MIKLADGNIVYGYRINRLSNGNFLYTFLSRNMFSVRGLITDASGNIIVREKSLVSATQSGYDHYSDYTVNIVNGFILINFNSKCTILNNIFNERRISSFNLNLTQTGSYSNNQYLDGNFFEIVTNNSIVTSNMNQTNPIQKITVSGSGTFTYTNLTLSVTSSKASKSIKTVYNSRLLTQANDFIVNSFNSGIVTYNTAAFKARLNRDAINDNKNTIIRYGYAGLLQIVYRCNDGTVRSKKYNGNTNTFGTEVILATGKTTDLLNYNFGEDQFRKIGTNKIFLGTGLIDGYNATILTQDANGDLSIESSQNIANLPSLTSIQKFNRFLYNSDNNNLVFIEDNNYFSIISLETFQKTNSIKVPNRYTTGEYCFPQIVGSSQSTNYYNGTSFIYSDAKNVLAGGHYIASDGHLYSAIASTYLDGSNYDLFFQKVQILGGDFVTSDFYSINRTVTGMTEFTLTANQNIETGTSISWFYSLDNGVSYYPLTLGTRVSAVSNQIKLKATLTPSGTLTPRIFDYKLNVKI